VHVLHVSSADELPLLAAHRDLATFEITPQHLTLAAPECYERLGTRAQMNPPLRDASQREALRRAAAGGLADVVGSDHAPHTLEEKAGEYPDTPSGMTGVQTLVPVLLDHVNAGWLSLRRFVELTSAGPARVFGIGGKGRLAPGYDADLTLVDLRRRETVRREWIRSRCGWSPFEGVTLTGWPVATVLRGRLVMREGELLGAPAGRPLAFQQS
jgi:dihydroorotase